MKLHTKYMYQRPGPSSFIQEDFLFSVKKVPRYTTTVLNFAEVIVKLPAVVAIWLICQHLVYKLKPPQSSVLSFTFNELLIYILHCIL